LRFDKKKARGIRRRCGTSQQHPIVALPPVSVVALFGTYNAFFVPLRWQSFAQARSLLLVLLPLLLLSRGVQSVFAIPLLCPIAIVEFVECATIATAAIVASMRVVTTTPMLIELHFVAVIATEGVYCCSLSSS
jgi:hypothetical protein